MEDWIYKADLRADWMSLIFFINSIIILLMYRLASNRFIGLLNLFNMHHYFGKFSHEKELNYSSYFNILSYLLITSSLAMAYFSLSHYFPYTLNYSFEFVFLFMGLLVILSLRFYLFQFIAKQLGFLNPIAPLIYKNFSYATQLAIYLTALLFFKNYSILPAMLFEGIIFLLFTLWLIQQFRIIFPFFRAHLRDGIYIILYLCAFKIAPWIWIYFMSIETQL